MNGQTMPHSGIVQHLLEELAVLVIAEDRRTIIAAQDDVQRDAFGEITRETGHAGILA
jgi:hypothetical protein